MLLYFASSCRGPSRIRLPQGRLAEDPSETQLFHGNSGNHAAVWMVVRDGVDPSTSGFQTGSFRNLTWGE